MHGSGAVLNDCLIKFFATSKRRVQPAQRLVCYILRAPKSKSQKSGLTPEPGSVCPGLTEIRATCPRSADKKTNFLTHLKNYDWFFPRRCWMVISSERLAILSGKFDKLPALIVSFLQPRPGTKRSLQLWKNLWGFVVVHLGCNGC